jgi:hypothetical protein
MGGFVSRRSRPAPPPPPAPAPVAAVQSEASSRTESLGKRKTAQGRAAGSAASTLGGAASDSSMVFKKLLGQ